MNASFSAELVRRCLKGESEAFEPLVRCYQNAAYATALHYVSDRAEAQDMVQDAFVAAYSRLVQLRDPSRFGPWLQRIVANRCKNYLRDRSRLCPLESAEVALELAAVEDHAGHVKRQDLWEAVEQLPENYRSAALMYYLSGFSYQEIADFMEVPVSTVRGRLQQARKRLRRTLEREEFIMEKIDVAGPVQEVVCQIATRQVRESMSLDNVENLVLYCGVDVEVEIRQAAAGEQAVLEGTLSAIGTSLEQAQESVDSIEIETDRVESYLESGPHKGEVFLGTSGSKDKISASKSGTVELWKEYIREERDPHGTYNDIRSGDLFPYMNAYANAMPASMRRALGKAARFTILRKEMEDIVLPRSAFTPEVQRVFRANNTSSERVHGPVGFAHLTLYVPPGKTTTIVEAHKVRVFGLKGGLNLITSTGERIEDVEGEVYLYDSACETARGIRGKLYQRHHQYPSTNWSDNQARRNPTGECRLEDIAGEVDIDAGYAQIEAAQLSGKIRICNRYGSTQLRQDHCEEESRINLESCSGDIRFLLGGELLGEAHLSAATLCGQIDYRALQGVDVNQSNNYELILITTLSGGADLREAQVQMKSESGGIRIEKAG